MATDVTNKWHGKYIYLLKKDELMEYCKFLERRNIKMAGLLSNTRHMLNNCMVANDQCSKQIQKAFDKFEEIEEEYERSQNSEVVEQISQQDH